MAGGTPERPAAGERRYSSTTVMALAQLALPQAAKMVAGTFAYSTVLLGRYREEGRFLVTAPDIDIIGPV